MSSIWPYIQQIILSRFGQAAVLFIILSLAVGTAYQRGWLGAAVASPWFWIALGLLLLIGVFCAIRFGVPRWRERQFLKRQSSEYLAAGQHSPEELRAKFLFTLQTLKGLPQLRGGIDPVYALPWYLLIGEPGAGKTAAVRAADLFSTLTAQMPEEGLTPNFDWWVSNNAVVVDTTGRYASPTDLARDRSEWYRLLRLIRRRGVLRFRSAAGADRAGYRARGRRRASGSRRAVAGASADRSDGIVLGRHTTRAVVATCCPRAPA